MRDNFAALIFVLAALVVMGISWLTRSSLPISRDWGKLLGELIFVLGMAVFVWAAVLLKGAFRGTVAPVSDLLVRKGPYSWVRHPLYLSMIVTLFGITVALRSLWGMIGLFSLFIPAVIYRAKLEEEALAEAFGDDWDAYISRTSFLVPWIW